MPPPTARQGFRALGVAVAPEPPEGASPTHFRFLGYIPIREVHVRGTAGRVLSERERWVRVPVWSAPLRWLHWLDFAAVLTLILTGLFIANPLVQPAGRSDPTRLPDG